MRVTLGKWWPLLSICVPISACVSPRRKRSRMRDQLPFLARRIAVEHLDRDVGKIAAETLLHFLGAEADRLQHFAIAERALRRNRLAQSAVVADQQSGAAVDGQRDAAVAAAELVAAFAA